MITDKETNFVYFSKEIADKDKYPEYMKSFNEVLDALKQHSIEVGLLEGTRDIWCRDYMPIQIERSRFISFRYEPSYLNTKEGKEKRSVPGDVCRENDIGFDCSPINIDGGNVIKWKDKVILTERIFKENKVSRQKEKNELVSKIEEILQVKIILIPDLIKKLDPFGHADGYIRFINDDTVIVNKLDQESPEYSRDIEKILKKNSLGYKEMPWFIDNDSKNNDSAVGNYINFLEVGNLILLPEYKGHDKYEEHNKKAYDTLKGIFGTEKIIEQIEMTPIAKKGGVLNCISWNIIKGGNDGI